MSALIEVKVPDLGNFDSVAVVDVLVKVGDAIDIDTPLATLETDKATMDVPSTAKGIVEKVHIAKGGSVSPGTVIVSVKGAAPADAAAKPVVAAPATAAPAPAAAPVPAVPPKESPVEVRVADTGS